MIRDQIKTEHEKVKAVAMKEKAAAAKARARKPVAEKPVSSKPGPKSPTDLSASKAPPVKRRSTMPAKPVDVPVEAG